MRHDETPDVLYHELAPDELLSRVGEGDAGAVEQLYYRHRDTILTYSWVMTGDQDTAVEAVKTSFSGLFEEIGTLDSGAVLPFLFRRARGVLLDVRDRPGVASAGQLELDGNTLAGEQNWTGPSSEVTISEDTEAAIRTLLNMPAGLRDAVVLRLVFKKSGEALRIIQDVPPEKVQVRLNEGLKRLQKQMDEVDAGLEDGERSCSMARMRTWLDRVVSDGEATDGSSMEQHLDRCPDCREVREQLRAIRDRLASLRSMSLPPFPKGDESDLLSEARDAAERINVEPEESRSMDPDLKQVLWLLPGGLLLLVAVAVLPLLFQEGSGDPGSPGEVRSSGGRTRTREVLVLETGGDAVTRVDVVVALAERVALTEVVPAGGVNGVRIERRSVSNNERRTGPNAARFELIFSSPYTGDERAVVELMLEGPSSGKRVRSEPVVRSATGPDGAYRAVQVRFRASSR